jgi:hypothetical protein
MEKHGMVKRLILEAYKSKIRITVKMGVRFYEGMVERIYENEIVKFSIAEGNRFKTAFFLISDIEAVLEEI